MNFVFNVPVKTLFFYFSSNCQDCVGGGKLMWTRWSLKLVDTRKNKLMRERERERERENMKLLNLLFNDFSKRNIFVVFLLRVLFFSHIQLFKISYLVSSFFNYAPKSSSSRLAYHTFYNTRLP